jgi:hypothetical protein
MARVRRHPGKIERYLEWTESIFWFVPLGIVMLGAGVGAVAIYLFGSLFTSGCSRVLGPSRQKSFGIRPEQAKSRRTGMIPQTASPTHQRLEPAASCSLLMLKRPGKSRVMRTRLAGSIPLRQRKCASSLAVPRFPGAPTIGRSAFGRF